MALLGTAIHTFIGLRAIKLFERLFLGAIAVQIWRHVTEGKTCAVKGAGLSVPQLKPSSFVSVKASEGKFAAYQGVEVLSPGIIL